MTDAASNDSLSVEISPDEVIVAHGDIDIAGGPILEAVILSHEREHSIVINLADVFFIDSSGLRSLLGASRRARTRGAEIVLRAVGPEVKRLLEITGTTDEFTFEDSSG